MKRLFLFAVLFMLCLIPSSVMAYVAKSGDSVASIASEHNTTTDELVKLNTWMEERPLCIGDEIVLPQTQAQAKEAEERLAKEEAARKKAEEKAFNKAVDDRVKLQINEAKPGFWLWVFAIGGFILGLVAVIGWAVHIRQFHRIKATSTPVT